MKERSKIDLKLWKRNKIYNIFSQYDDPYTGLISKIDVTNIITFLNDNDYSFYGTMVYLCLCVFNEREVYSPSKSIPLILMNMSLASLM